MRMIMLALSTRISPAWGCGVAVGRCIEGPWRVWLTAAHMTANWDSRPGADSHMMHVKPALSVSQEGLW